MTTNMELHFSTQGVAIILTMIVHLCGGVWLAASVVSQLKNLNDNIMRVEKELEKRDVQIAALWKRTDEIRDFMMSQHFPDTAFNKVVKK